MIIIHSVNDFLFELFDIEEGNIKELKKALIQFYTVGPVKPKIEISNDLIKISLDINRLGTEQTGYQKLISLCETSKFEEAKEFAIKLIESNPNVSEYHRILGQVYSDLGNQEEAINSLIYALKWDPENVWALIMIGNIFAKYKDDIDTAMKYYHQVLIVKPNDNITLNNIGGNLMQLGRTEEATIYFNKALKEDPDYPNTYFGLSMASDSKSDFKSAFYFALNAIEKNKSRNQLYGESIRLAVSTAKSYSKEIDGQGIIEKFISELSGLTKKKILIENDDSIPTAAKIEFGENYNRDYHIIKYKSNYPSVEHLVMHELIHLQLAHEARELELNQLFTTNQSFKAKFFYSLSKEVNRLKKKGFSEESLASYLTALFDGINRQSYNTPIDLFIEDRLYKKYEELRPFQFLSLFALIQEGIEATTNKDIVALTPTDILSKSKIFNLVNAIHFKSLFKIDLIKEHNPTKRELEQAEEFYREYLQYQDDKEPGEEYELVQHWAEDMKLDGYFELVPETEYKRQTIEKVISEIEDDPFGVNSPNSSQERRMKQFMENHADKDVNMAICMFMVGALQYFQNLSTDKIKEIAFQIATIGVSGIDPEKQNYSVPLLKGEVFTGYRLLAYYYVSWALVLPEMLPELRLPFDKEYELAKQINGFK